ncbi:hypothetical protein BJ878DRAFT_488637 [Calycina marina]|uniref:Cytochrome c oxidase-assembly factor COX23, mitochondrial n=1 Tax=Calycina marina TaxID=1763456 RepID=A0A9P8CIX9_9HELO|nr:hypothetical protein BJ878DRAFT_488637 [Calycina marina]
MATKEPPEESPWDPKTSQKFENKRPGEYFDPCQEASARSMKCLHRNANNKEMCNDYFQAYRDCKKQWMAERKEAKLKNAKPWF